jgi:hypothetical protein
MQKTNYAFLILIAGVFIFSCSKTNNASTGTTAKNPVGVTSSAALFEAGGSLSADSPAGTAVTATNGAGSFKATTDAQGNFTLPVIPVNGMVTITYSHEGFGEMKEYYAETAYDSIQNGVLSADIPSLYRLSPVVVNSLTSTLNGTELKLTCNVTAPGDGYAVRFAVSKSNDVSYDNCKDFKNISASFPVTNGDNTITICTPCEQDCGFNAGDTLYIKAYGDLIPPIMYYDRVAKKYVLACVNTSSKSQVVSFVVGKKN